MHAKDSIRNTYELSQMVLRSYVDDLTDEELLSRPSEGCNHLAWQLGHLVSSEASLLESIVPGQSVTLPESFVTNHGKENKDSNDPSHFESKDAYLAHFDSLKEATYKALDEASDEFLAAPAPEHMQGFCANNMAMFVLIATHVMMHVGQFVPVRRNLGKPVVI